MERVTFKTDGGEALGSLALPGARARGPRAGALIVVHEWWGKNAEIEAMTERFASEGFLALAVDLYGGKVTDDPAVAMQLSSDMKTSEALVTLRGAVLMLASHPSSNGKVGVTGFCLGGAIAMSAAFQIEGLSAALPFYGNPRADFVDFTKNTPPIQGHYATRDGFVDAKRTKEIFDGVKSAGGEAELFYYEANHAFMRVGDATAYDEASAKLAWSRAIPFLEKHLG